MDYIVEPEGFLIVAQRRLRCALGRGGIAEAKREGDGVTPAGAWPLRELLYRPDRLPAPATALPRRAITERDGWCDAPDDPNYNRPVTLPYEAGHERLWREDHLYDLVVVLGYNDDPVRPGLGSAIFLHVAAPDYAPTEGCVALAADDLVAFVGRCGVNDRLRILTGSRPG